MIPQPTMNVDTIESNIDGESIQMTIDEGSLQHIMSVLTDLYSDTVLATVRELSTNARDTHVEAGRADLPIEISSPSGFTPVFKVKDHGTGLSLEDIRNVFSKYGASTKRGSNDVNGMLGLGAKSPLTYTSSFTVVSTKDGVTNVVSVGRSEEGGGYMEIVDTFTSNDPSGTEIQVPVSRQDIHTFVQKIERLFSFWDAGTVKIDGVLNTGYSCPDGIKINDRTYAIPGFGSDSAIVMGGVPYPLPFENPMSVSFVHFADIGDVTFSPSRESLLTNKKNKDRFDAILAGIKAGALDAVRGQVENAPTPADAVREVNKIQSGYLSRIIGRAPYVNFMYNGEDVETIWQGIINAISSDDNTCGGYIPAKGSSFSIVTFNEYYKTRLARFALDASLIVSGVGVDVVDHAGRRTAILRGLRHLGYEHEQVIFCDDHTEISKVLSNTVKVIDVSAVREASRQVLKENKSNPKVKKPKAPADMVEVIDRVSSEATAQTTIRKVTGDGTDMVYIARSRIRESGTVPGSNTYERANSFNGILKTFPTKTFVAVSDGEREKFLKAYPKAVSFNEFSKDVSTKKFVARVIAEGQGKFDLDDLLVWVKGVDNSPSWMVYNTPDLFVDSYFEVAQRASGSTLLEEYRVMVEKSIAISTATKTVRQSLGGAYNRYTGMEYLKSLIGDKDISTPRDLENQMKRKYPLIVAVRNGASHDDVIEYVKAVDSNLLG